MNPSIKFHLIVRSSYIRSYAVRGVYPGRISQGKLVLEVQGQVPPPQKTAMKNTARSSWPGLSPLYTRGSAPMDPSPTGQAIGVWCRVNQGGVSLGKPITSSLNWFLGCWKLRYFSHIQVGGSPRADAGNAGEILSLRWFGNTSEEVDKEKIWESLLRWLLPEPRPGWVSGKKTWMENIWNGNKKINRVNNATVCHYF